MERGKFITFEGGEGAGKSTQVRLLAKTIEAAGHSVVVTREPGGAVGAEQIRALLVSGAVDRWQPMTEALLNYAARSEHVAQTIEPALAAGTWVLSDRFADSTMAYQGYGHGLALDKLADLQAIVLGAFAPDLTYILDLPVDVGLGRALGRGDGEDRYERMDIQFHTRLRDGFLDIAGQNPERCVVIDAARDIEAIQRSLIDVLHQKFAGLLV